MGYWWWFSVLLVVGSCRFIGHKRKKNSGKRKGDEDLPAGWSSFIDEASGYPCYVNDATGDTTWDKPESTRDVEMTMANPMGAMNKNKVGGDHKRNSPQLPDGWEKHEDEEGNRYYAEEATGMTAWDHHRGVWVVVLVVVNC